MSSRDYNVIKCTQCGAITLKRASIKKPKCVKCKAVNKFEILEKFPSATDATTYIQRLNQRPSSREFHFGQEGKS